MALKSGNQFAHRPGPLKQTNKRHKGWKSKGNKTAKGKIDVKSSGHRQKHELNRQEKRNQLNQLRKSKRENVLKKKRQLGGLNSAPVLTTIIAVDDQYNPVEFLEKIKNCDDELVCTESSLGQKHIRSQRFKHRYTFLTPNKNDLHSVMDALKVSDMLILLHSADPCDAYTEMLLSVIMHHALPTTLHVIQGLEKLNPKKKNEYRKTVIKNIESRFPEPRILSVDSDQEVRQLLRQVGDHKRRVVAFRDNRFHLLVEGKVFTPSEEDPDRGTLEVIGYVRGQQLDVNALVHLPGWGTFQMHRVDTLASDPHAPERIGDMHLGVAEMSDPSNQESLDSEVIPDPMEGEQTWPTEEELELAEVHQPKKTVRKVAEGISDYQAAWIVDSEGEEESGDSSSEEEEEEMEADGSEDGEEPMLDTTESVIDIADNYDKDFEMDEEKKSMVRFKEERMNEMFPDELDTPMDVPARVRFQKYRGLKHFGSAPWDPLENLPLDYARIYRFAHFKNTKKKALEARTGIEVGEYVRIHIANVPRSVYDSARPLVAFGLLKHEQKMSVVNAVVRKSADCHASIKSKDSLVFHVGFRRFTAQPVFSEHRTGNKFKYERFMPSDSSVVASFFAPVTFPPAPVLLFRHTASGRCDLVACGSVLSVDPDRVVVKRAVLSGHPFRIYKRSAVVRYMFFSKEDIDWFKVVELRTKMGRRGHITDSIGSHGHMKCVFDEQLNSQDVVLMSLYKRVFPKWTYDPYVPEIEQ